MARRDFEYWDEKAGELAGKFKKGFHTYVINEIVCRGDTADAALLASLVATALGPMMDEADDAHHASNLKQFIELLHGRSS